MGAQRINLLSLSGAVVGFASLFATWLVLDIPPYLEFLIPRGAQLTLQLNLLELPSAGNIAVPMPDLSLAAALFLAGSVAAFATPLGGLVQLAGVSAFLWAAAPFLGPYYRLGPGPFVGAVAGIIALAGMVRPVGLGYDGGRMSLGERVLTVTRRSEVFGLNLLSLLGGTGALLSILLPWMTYVYRLVPLAERQPHTLVGLLTDLWWEGSIGEIAIGLGGTLFLAGSVAAFISPLGSLAQLLGLLLFSLDVVGGPSSSARYLDVGFYVGMVAAVVVLLAFFLRVGVGWREGEMSREERLFVWHLPARSA